MRRTLAVIAVLAAAAGFSPAEAQEATDRQASWSLVAAGADGRSLKLVYEAGGCSHRDGRVIVTETKWEIGIEVRHTVANAQGCTADSLAKPLVAQLDAPIDGRYISGPLRLGPGPLDGRRVPRVIGLSLPDAARVLAERGYHVRTTGLYRGGTVISQRRRGRTVTLRFTYSRR